MRGRMWERGVASHGEPRNGWRRRLIMALCLSAGIALLGYNLVPTPARAALAVSPATTPTPTTGASAASTDDPFATGQPMAHYLGKPDSWEWRSALPGARIILYFGIAGTPAGGVIGWYGNDEAGLLNQLRNQGQGYAQVDPSHPVMMGLDLVNPLADALPQQGYYIDRMDPSIIQHYADLAHDNHMLFFMDMQIEKSTVQRELAYILPYLQLPWVDIALDPEWDHAFGGQEAGCNVGFDPNITGRTRVSEINYLIDQLSALVVSKHLPPKILIIHQYQFGENPANRGYICSNAMPSEGWQNIVFKPGVQIVVNTDGVGGPEAKTADYIAFDHDQHIQYPGIKLYYYYPILTPNFYDTPLMSPAQVLSLDPPPLLIMYQ
ncbi:MAG TPA: hypothetical protein VF818_00820 [Ktedonobacterales bacterium]